MTVDDEPVPGAAVQLELFSPDRLQVGEGLAALAALEKLLLNLESNELKPVPPALCSGTVLLELDRKREAAAALESSARLVGDDPSWLLVHANALWRLRLATRSRSRPLSKG